MYILIAITSCKCSGIRAAWMKIVNSAKQIITSISFASGTSRFTWTTLRAYSRPFYHTIALNELSVIRRNFTETLEFPRELGYGEKLILPIMMHSGMSSSPHHNCRNLVYDIRNFNIDVVNFLTGDDSLWWIFRFRYQWKQYAFQYHMMSAE